MNVSKLQNLVLAVYPFSRGFAFVFFEGPESPFEWGVRELKGNRKNGRTLDEIKKLIDRYRPEALILEETDGGSRRTARIRTLYKMLTHLAAVEYVDVYRYTRREVNECFAGAGAHTKFDIAQAIAMRIPAFGHRMPPYRKPWLGEDPRQSLFDAAALGVTHFARANGDSEA